jgi:hypothetical protein
MVLRRLTRASRGKSFEQGELLKAAGSAKRCELCLRSRTKSRVGAQFATHGRKPPPPLVELGHQSRGRAIHHVAVSPLNPLRTLQLKIIPAARSTLALSLHRFAQDFRPYWNV